MSIYRCKLALFRAVEIEAESPAEAIRLAEAMPTGMLVAAGGGLIAEAVETPEGDELLVMGMCESCDIALVEGDDFVDVEDDTRLCRACATKEEA